jgi:hypothetical protein
LDFSTFIGMAFKVHTSKSKNKEEQEVEKLEDDPQANGGVAVTPWKPTKWDETKLARTRVRMNVELGHVILAIELYHLCYLHQDPMSGMMQK